MAENPLRTILDLDGKLAEHLDATEKLVFQDGVMPEKYKILMAMAFDAAHGAAQGVRALAERAMRAGATEEEIAETIRVAYHLGGVGSVYTASQGLKDLFH